MFQFKININWENKFKSESKVFWNLYDFSVMSRWNTAFYFSKGPQMFLINKKFCGPLWWITKNALLVSTYRRCLQFSILETAQEPIFYSHDSSRMQNFSQKILPRPDLSSHSSGPRISVVKIMTVDHRRRPIVALSVSAQFKKPFIVPFVWTPRN